MNIIEAAQAENIKNPHGVAVSKLYDTEHAQVMHITLKPGEALKKHAGTDADFVKRSNKGERYEQYVLLSV